MFLKTGRKLFVALAFFGVVFALGASLASAQIWGRWGAAAPNVTCNVTGGTPCGFCDALMVTSNVIDFATKISLIIAAAMFAYGGIRLMLSAGSSGGVTSAKKIITGAVVGLVITLCAWLIVNTLLTFLSPGGHYSLTNPVQCTTPVAVPFVPVDSGAPGGGSSNGSGGGNTYSEQDARVELKGTGVDVKDPCTTGQTVGCVSLNGVQQNTIDGVINLKARCPQCIVFITGGTEGGHEGGTFSHGTGYKLDLSADQTLTNFIKGNANTFQYAGERGGTHGGPIYRDIKTGNEYVLESNPAHWDVTFR